MLEILASVDKRANGNIIGEGLILTRYYEKITLTLSTVNDKKTKDKI